jgi:heme exporter protein A
MVFVTVLLIYGRIVALYCELIFMLNVIDLDFDYQDAPLLQKICLHVPEQGLMHVRGGNGAGKTTLLKVLAGLYRPSQGQILFRGTSIHAHLNAYHSQLAYVGHKSGVNPYLTVREHCLLEQLWPEHADIMQLLAVFNLASHKDTLCGLLSAGQRRQVALLRLWISKAPLWLLDEPLVALDERAVATLMARMQAHRQLGGAVILTSHQSLPLASSEYQEYCL